MTSKDTKPKPRAKKSARVRLSALPDQLRSIAAQAMREGNTDLALEVSEHAKKLEAIGSGSPGV